MQKFDEANLLIADYVANYQIKSELAYKTAKISLQDALGCAILSLKFPDCQKLLGPTFKGIHVNIGSKVIGTNMILDPIQAAFNMGTMIRYLDYNDTFLGKEWAHPSDNLGAILALSDFLCRNGQSVKVKDLLELMIKAYEIQGNIALSNSFNTIGFDHVILVKIASSAVSAKLLNKNEREIFNTLSNAWIDTGPLRTYRHFPNTGSRKSWAAGDQTARGLYFASLTEKNEMGYETALSAKRFGLYDVLFHGKPFQFEKPFDTFIMENILYKVSFPAEFHAQTAIEAAISLHPKVKNQLQKIESIEIETQEPAIRIINKTGELENHADRDHCLQYMVAVALMNGELTENDYSDEASKNPMIDLLREKMTLKENVEFTKNYYDLNKRSIGNSIKITFKDQTVIGPYAIEYPLGHRLRRNESLPLLQEKFKKNLSSYYSEEKVEDICKLFEDEELFLDLKVSKLIDIF